MNKDIIEDDGFITIYPEKYRVAHDGIIKRKSNATGGSNMSDPLLDSIKAHRSAPDVYDPPTFDKMAERIFELEAKLLAMGEDREKNREKTDEQRSY